MARDGEAEPERCPAARQTAGAAAPPAECLLACHRRVLARDVASVATGYPACMTTGTDALFCSVCSGYVHPFLDACPTCGATHASRYDEAVRGDSLGLASLPADPDLRARATARSRTNTLVTSRGFPAMAGSPSVEQDEQADLPELLNEVTGRFQYRMWLGPGEEALSDGGPSGRQGTGPHASARPEAIEARLRTETDRLLLERAGGGNPVEFPLATIRSVGIVRGAGMRGTSVPLPPRGAEVALTASTPEGLQLLHIGNPGSLFATKARSDHFGILAWWLGVAAGVTAERRWMALGPARHAAEPRLAGGGIRSRRRTA